MAKKSKEANNKKEEVKRLIQIYENKKVSNPFDVVLNKYAIYLIKTITKEKKEGKRKPESDTETVVKNCLTIPSAFQYLINNNLNLLDVEKNFLTLLPKLLYCNEDRRKDDINKLIEFIRCSACKLEWSRKNKADSKKSYLISFLEYVQNELLKKKNRTILQEEFKQKYNERESQLELTDEDKKCLEDAFNMRIIYLHDVLCKKFKSRLRCQDRVSGDKVWLPLRFIAKLYIPKGRKKQDADSLFSKWLNNLVNDVYVHYLDGNTVKHAKFNNEQVYLELRKIKDKDEYEVYVILSKDGRQGSCFRALTPTGKGNIKVEMTVRNINAIAIDHIKSIDQTLRDLDFDVLTEVSNQYRKLQETKNPEKEEQKFVDDLRNNLNLKGLYNELESIRKDGLLRLMDSRYNTQKSNASTFQKIVKYGNNPGVYYGILENQVEIKDDKGNRVYYYQELTDNIKERLFYVTKKEHIIKAREIKKSELRTIISKI